MPVRPSTCMIAEFIGTFALTFIGIFACNCAYQIGGPAGLVLAGLAHGIALAVMVTAAMPTSGGHINPAITIGFLVTGKIKPGLALAYIVAQCLGATVAALCVFLIAPHYISGVATSVTNTVYLGTPDFGNIGPMPAFLAEFIATFFLSFVVWGTAADPRARKVGGLAIGLTIAADIMAIGALTGGSMNPARSFGPTLVGAMTGGPNLWSHAWLYWVAPAAGASLAALVYNTFLWPREPAIGGA